jgi:hypothetical protein
VETSAGGKVVDHRKKKFDSILLENNADVLPDFMFA